VASRAPRPCGLSKEQPTWPGSSRRNSNSKETKGALRYQEIDDKGAVIEQAWAKVGVLYIRKWAFERGAKYPRHLSVKIGASGTVEPVVA
jgi:hypothetical protein